MLQCSCKGNQEVWRNQRWQSQESAAGKERLQSLQYSSQEVPWKAGSFVGFQECVHESAESSIQGEGAEVQLLCAAQQDNLLDD